jgi:chemotaxis protein MotB
MMIKLITRLSFGLLMIGMVSSCVSKKKFMDMQSSEQARYDQLKNDCDDEKDALTMKLKEAQTSLDRTSSEYMTHKENSDKQVKMLQDELTYVKSTNTNLLERLSDLSVISKTGAESIKKSLESLNEQSKYIQDLSKNIQMKDSMNLALVMNLKRSLADVNDEDVQVEVKKGLVYVSISDKLLFRSGSSVVSREAMDVLEKVSKVLNDHANLAVLVEGHTDNVPIATDDVKDNWDLSVQRATAVVRVLTNKYKVDASRLTAGGRADKDPKADNNTRDGRKVNRRTEIIITPQMDQFFNLTQRS